MLVMKLAVEQRSENIIIEGGKERKKLKKGDGMKTNNVNFKYMRKKNEMITFANLHSSLFPTCEGPLIRFILFSPKQIILPFLSFWPDV